MGAVGVKQCRMRNEFRPVMPSIHRQDGQTNNRQQGHQNIPSDFHLMDTVTRLFHPRCCFSFSRSTKPQKLAFRRFASSSSRWAWRRFRWKSFNSGKRTQCEPEISRRPLHQDKQASIEAEINNGMSYINANRDAQRRSQHVVKHDTTMGRFIRQTGG